MADITVTAASVVAASSASRTNETAGGTITAGQAVFKNSSNVWLAAQADSADTAGTAGKIGIALNGAAINQPVSVVTAGALTAGATLVVGETYVLSAAAAGGIAPVGDLETGDYVTVLGVATSTSVLAVAPQATATAHA